MNNVKLDQLPTVKCKCGNETFEGIAFLKVIPGILAGTPTDQLLPVPAFRCIKCKTLFDFGKYDRKQAGEDQKKNFFG